jgi:ATP/maltotriose-dependent transcriptional regulator MalT
VSRAANLRVHLGERVVKQEPPTLDLTNHPDSLFLTWGSGEEKMASRTARAGQTASPPLVVTKLDPPAAREQTVVRGRLLEQLQPGPSVKLIVVAAPAGSGKTTLLGMWREAQADVRPVAWLTLEKEDNDPVILWAHALEALRKARPGLGETLSPESLFEGRIADLMLPQLVNELSEHGDIVFILDDFDRVSSGASRDTIAWLIEHAPSTFHLVLASRNEPGLPLGALRARGELLEVRADDLRFTADEAEELLNERLELGLARADIEPLVERTEGWAAGIYLAALSLGGVEDRGAFAREFGGTNRHVIDFLVDEVLDAHSPELRALMLRSSVLERLSGPLCDAVLEQDGSREQLIELSRSNLFLVPLDDRNEWFRFHRLFAQLLRVELAHREQERVPALHRRAYAWYRDHGFPEQAIDHALEAGTFAEATELISTMWGQVAAGGRQAMVAEWLARFPPEVVRESPRLLLVQAGLAPSSDSRPDGPGSSDDGLEILRAALPWGDVGSGYEAALRAAEVQGPGSPFRAAICWSLALGSYNRGDLGTADRWFTEAAEAGKRDERWLIAASALAYRSLIAGENGEPAEQARLAGEAHKLAHDHDVDRVKGEVDVAVGASLATEGRTDEALPVLARGISVLRKFGSPLDLANGLLCEARFLRSVGRDNAAASAIEEAAQAIETCRDPGVLPERLDALRPPPHSRRRNATPELTERERAVLRMLNGPLSEREIGRELYLSHNTIHSHTKSIYRKLGASSRREAVKLARSLAII